MAHYIKHKPSALRCVMPPELLLLPWMLLVLSCSLYREPWQQLLSCLVWSLSSGTVVPSELHAECFNLCLRQTYPPIFSLGGVVFSATYLPGADFHGVSECADQVWFLGVRNVVF